MRKLLEEAVARGAEATLVTTESKNTSVSFEANRLKRIGSTESLKVLEMQVIKAGKAWCCQFNQARDRDGTA